MTANITNPHYYVGKSGLKVYDVIDEFGFDFYEGNALKYLVRWSKKNGLEDLEKAKEYIEEIIRRTTDDSK